MSRNLFLGFSFLGIILILPTNANRFIMNSLQEPRFSYLALGDSYTIGESVPSSGRWSHQLAELLRASNTAVSDPDIIARTGWTTSELSDAIRSARSSKKYSLVSLLIGVNNQYRGESIEKFRKEFRALLATAVSFASGKAERVFVLSIPDWGVTPFAATSDRKKIAVEIDSFNNVIRKECSLVGIKFIDITTLSRTALNDPAMIAPDGLHFSGKMYSEWAALALPEVIKILRD
jgi:lysophospholipase L1-like esterase